MRGYSSGVVATTSWGFHVIALGLAPISVVQATIAGGLVLTDMWGGSCHQSGASVARGHGEVVVIAGLNLPTLLDYLHNREQTTVSELAERLLRKGQDSIRVQRGLPA